MLVRARKDHYAYRAINSESEGYKQAMQHLKQGTNEFYQLLGQGTLKAAKRYGGKDFACILGQEMGGYATGEVFFASQALGLRHSHLDSGGYSYDQKEKSKDPEKAVDFLVKDEQGRVLLTSMVACLFARGVYTDELLSDCLRSVGYAELADSLGPIQRTIQKLRWKARVDTGYRPEDVSIPKRFFEITAGKGLVDASYLDNLKGLYAKAITALAVPTSAEGPATAVKGK